MSNKNIRVEGHDNLFLMDTATLLFKTNQVAYPVGENKDSYSIHHKIWVSPTGVILDKKFEVIKNFEFTPLMQSESPKECYDYIKTLVISINNSGAISDEQIHLH